MRSFDAIVIGGGPAGSAAAHALASRGVATCLVDKSTFPREKLCGGLVTGKSKAVFEQAFGRTWDDNLFCASRAIEFHTDGRLLAAPPAHLHGTTMYFTMRFDFDAYLLQLARAAGAVLELGRRVSRIDFESRTVELDDGERLRYGHLVGADGVNSQVARELFGRSFDANTIGFGLEVEVPRDALAQPRDVVEIDIGAARWGYGWVFPKRRGYTIGVGGLHRHNPDMKQRLADYLARKKLSADAYRVKGQYIPFGDFRRAPGKGNVLLCGDAAGTVDPITGEGIAYAMQTGHAAGVAIAEGRDGALARYQHAYASVASSIAAANRWRYLIFPAFVMRHFSGAFADATSLQVWYLQMMAGMHGYDTLPRAFGGQLKKRLRLA